MIMRARRNIAMHRSSGMLVCEQVEVDKNGSLQDPYIKFTDIFSSSYQTLALPHNDAWQQLCESYL
jgi:hypothetical protein